MQRKSKNKETIISQSLNKNLYQSRDTKDNREARDMKEGKEKKRLNNKQKSKSKESIRCKSQNTHRIDEYHILSKKVQCKTHRLENSNIYHTLQTDKNQKLEDCYRKVIDEMNLHNDKLNFNQFSAIMGKIKKYLNKKVNLSEENLIKAWKVISKAENKITEKHLSFSLGTMSGLFTMSQELQKPRIKIVKPTKTINPKPLKIKKQASNSIVQKKQTSKPRKISKSFLSQKQNVDINKFYSQKPSLIQDNYIQYKQKPQLQVIVKIQQGIVQKLVVYPDTCLSTLAKQFGAKYKLPNSKIVMLRDMIESQLRRHLTQITEESADYYTSDRSGLFNTLNYDDI